MKQISEENGDVWVCPFVSIAAGETLKFDESPTTYAAKKENVDHVLHFMAAQRIKMRQISSKGKMCGHIINYLQLLVSQSVSQRISQSVRVSQSARQSYSLPACQSLSQSIVRSFILLFVHSFIRSFVHSFIQSVSQSVSQSVIQSASQSVSQ